MRRFVRLLPAGLVLAGCHSGDSTAPRAGPEPAPPLALSTDKAAYAPGDAVAFALSGSAPAGARVRYLYDDSLVGDAPVAGAAWSWQPPTADFRGYLAEVYRAGDGTDTVLATVGIDVSSDWTRFPRYGFLSRYPAMTVPQIDAVIGDLTRHHINGLQFYDWHHAPHQLLPDSGQAPPPTWSNIWSDSVHLATVAGYIAAAHARNTKAMFYDLIYGALKDAEGDGVSDQWRLFADASHQTPDVDPLPQPPFVSDIYVVDPGNTGWRSYFAGQVDRVYAALAFDGFHMDQLGDRGLRYAYDGTPVDLASSFQGFITAMHDRHPERYVVMNAVNQYGEAGIAAAPTAFLYTEVWPPNEGYADLATLIRANDSLAGGAKRTVLAAYVNYGLADQVGVFDTPSVLLADAVIFAFGGDHLELGEHMLGKEFFPNDNLAMKTDLREALVPYYDFLVAYEDLLRGGGTFDAPALTTSGAVPLAAWPPRLGTVAVVGKLVGTRQVLHLVNFTDAATLRWRDDAGIQPYPTARTQIPLQLATSQPVARIWYATPDRDLGAPRALPFTQSGTAVSFTLPYLKYWSMLVVECR